jgi:acetyltransferase-like isoleucine patch superfamily enzyme
VTTFVDTMKTQHKNIFQRLIDGEAVSFSDAEYPQIIHACSETRKLLLRLNAAADDTEIRELLSRLTGTVIDANTALFPPFQINYGKNTRIGKNVFINCDCTFLDLGGIVIEDDVLIAPKVSLLSEGHPVSPKERRTLTVGRIHIKKNAWIGANATIMQGVTIGENSIVAAGAVVSKDVPDNSIVGGIPAKIIQTL